MRQCDRRVLGIAAAAAMLALAPAPAHAYEFEIHARTLGQGYSLSSVRFMSPALSLNRRRFTTTLALEIWDLGGRLKKLKLHQPHRRGPRFYISSYLRLDHDFGSWTGGELTLSSQTFDAVDLIPELESGSLALDVLYGFVAAEDLWDGRVDLRLGRLLEVDALDWYSFDGAIARVKTPVGIAVEAFGGARVRDGSPFGSNVLEPDGTSGGECAEYVEGTSPGTGTWQRIDEAGLDNNPFVNDFDLCPQRDELMPTWGFAAETDGWNALSARVSYRRAQSRTPGLIGAPNRLSETELDVGLYPNEHGQAPPWGVNEEMLSATARYRIDMARGKAQLTPYLAGRYSLLHGLFDEGHAGARLRYGSHSVESELYYSFPTFDGDSIFNVFSSEPYVDSRLTYDVKPKGAPWRAYVRGWLRRFISEDAADADEAVDASAYAGGGQAGAHYRKSRSTSGRVDLFHETGLGGRRTGGFVSGRWQPHELLRLASRLSVIDFDEDLREDLSGVSLGGQLGATYVVNPDGVGLHLMVEQTSNRLTRSATRLLVVLDLAFKPEI